MIGIKRVKSGSGPKVHLSDHPCPACGQNFGLLINGMISTPVEITCGCGHSYVIEAQ